MLFLQGTRDALANTDLIQSVIAGLRSPVTLKLAEQADHAFHVLVRSGTTDENILREMLDAFADWTRVELRST